MNISKFYGKTEKNSGLERETSKGRIRNLEFEKKGLKKMGKV